MRITVDTNLLIRLFVEDDPGQARIARAEVSAADLVSLPLASLCEFVWVLRSGYRIGPEPIADYLEALLATGAALNRPAVEAGLAAMAAGADFADGVIAHEGAMLGGDTFVSFDRQAVRAIRLAGLEARLAGSRDTQA